MDRKADPDDARRPWEAPIERRLVRAVEESFAEIVNY